MRCPFCGHEETAVKDSRPSEDGASIRRRRFCPSCDSRFTTFERIQLREMTVVKAGGRKQPFDRDKVIRSMQIALQKRPVALDVIEQSANEVVRQLESQGEAEITTAMVGEAVMQALVGLDAVGYIRYASVYKDFREPEDFGAFLDDLKSRQAKRKKKA
jgi:transcriptional repressor NrdR